jgi:hypothetical protein
VKQDLGGHQPPVLETPRPRTRSRPVPVATRNHLVLVPPDPSHRSNLDPAALVPHEEHSELPRRPRRTPPRAVVPTNYNNVPLRSRGTRNHRRPTRHARLRRIAPAVEMQRRLVVPGRLTLTKPPDPTASSK